MFGFKYGRSGALLRGERVRAGESEQSITPLSFVEIQEEMLRAVVLVASLASATAFAPSAVLPRSASRGKSFVMTYCNNLALFRKISTILGRRYLYTWLIYGVHSQYHDSWVILDAADYSDIADNRL